VQRYLNFLFASPAEINGNFPQTQNQKLGENKREKSLKICLPTGECVCVSVKTKPIQGGVSWLNQLNDGNL
jgi:hypothetical protein